MIHVYGLARGVRALPARRGIGGAPIRSEQIADIVAVVSDVDAEPERQEGALAHGLVVEELAERAEAVLPARYGERFGDSAALTTSISERLPKLHERLAAVAGCVELRVRLMGNAGPPPPRARSGTEYMQRKLEESRARRRVAAMVDEPLQRYVRATVDHASASGFVHDTSYLVRREDVDPFRSVVDEFAAAHRELTLVCTGPWAPYTFAGDGEGAP